jgi:DNA-directed RNA polymerases I and III subunit RPAC1
VTSANAYRSLGIDNSWNFDHFKSGFRIDVGCIDGDTMEFDMLGIDPAIANAFRRIIISEVPTMAIEHVYFVDNTSIIAVRRIC